MPQTADAGFMRQVNVSRILEAIQAKGILSRADIARQTGLSRPAVSASVAGLIERRVLVEVGKGQSSGGKRPTMLTFNGEAGYVLSAQVDGQGVRAGIHDLTGTLVREPFESGESPGTGERAVDAVVRAIGSLDTNGLSESVWGCGVAVSGIVDGNAGIVRSSAALGWEDYALAGAIEARLGFPSLLFHDVDAILLGEATAGAASEYDHALCVHTAEGVGASLLIDRRIYRGGRQAAGEIGESRLAWPPRARAGLYGDLDIAVARIRETDPAASDADAVRAPFILAVANAVALLDPQVVVLSGWICSRDDVVGELERALAGEGVASVPVLSARLGDNGALIGAAMGVVRQREERLSLHPLAR